MTRKYSLPENEVTPQSAYLNRRQIMTGVGSLALSSVIPATSFASADSVPHWLTSKVSSVVRRTYRADDPVTDYESATTYNNFYEFGTDKKDPARHAHEFNPHPWEIEVSGACSKPGTLSLEDLISSQSLEERIYRLRCVEAWSMVIPWIGIELSKVLAQFEPTSSARYVVFETVVREDEMRGQRDRFSFIDWPYVEGLRMDEAMHPLSFLAVGMYGESLPVQNGAPIRLVVPWKYGFKSIKSISAIRFVEKQPATTWNIANPQEYGFYSNVNPNRPHPRWSQAKERRIGANGKIDRIPTAMFNGYTEVADLYSGMNLDRYY